MAKAFDPTKRLRAFQNFTGLLIIYTLALAVVTYIAAACMLFAVSGKGDVIKLIETDPIRQPEAIYAIFTYYYSWWWQHWKALGFTGYNFFAPRLIASSGVPILTFLYFIFRYREKISNFRLVEKPESVHGDAHWATEREIRKVGLRAKKGMLMGQNKKGYLVTDGYQHALLFAPTGSGKGVGFVIPNLLFWEESVVCHDIKLENYQLTSGWRNKHLKQSIFVWEPSNPDGVTHCYNPIDWVSPKAGQMVDDVQKFSNLILQKKEFWENEARTLLVGVILYLVADTTKTKSFGEVVRQLRGDDFAYALAVVLDTMGEKLHPVGRMNLAAFLQKADKERSGVVSTLNSGLELWANPIIDAATARSDFNVQTFKKKPTTVYVGLTPDNIQRLKSLMSMFYQQSTDFLSKKMPGKDEPYGVLFLMDEFPTVGKLEQFLAGIAYFRGYHVRLFLIVQDTQQLKGTYENSGMNSFLSNAMFRITFAANNIDTAELISKLIGNQTVEAESFSKPRFFDMNPASRSMNISGTQRALLLPQEVISMERDDQIILVEASPPIRTQKIKYFKDKMFTKRLWKQTFVPTQEPVIVKHNQNAKDVHNSNPTTAALPSD
jgi:type IV secretion system protein VirD4